MSTINIKSIIHQVFDLCNQQLMNSEFGAKSELLNSAQEEGTNKDGAEKG
jgi:hypothetical protein